MSSVFPARRGADRFDALVEGERSPGARSDARYTQLLEVVAELKAVPAPAARPEFVAGLRANLMAEADLVLARLESELVLPAHPTTRRPRRGLAVAAGAIAMVGATSSIAMAAQSALPGDLLYPVKRALETAQTELASGDDRGAEMLNNAAGRLDEVSALAQRGDDEAAVAETIEEFSVQAQEAAATMLNDYVETGDESAIVELHEFTQQSMTTLESLDAIVPPSSHDELAQAALVLSEIDRLAIQVCPTCAGGVLELPPTLLASVSSTITAPRVPAGQQQIEGIDPSLVEAVQDLLNGDTQTGGATEPSGGDTDSPTDTDDPTEPLDPGDGEDGDLIDDVGSLLDGDKNTGGGSDPLGPVVEVVEETVETVTDPLIGEDGLVQ